MNKLNPTPAQTSIDTTKQKYESARANLLLVIVLTVANCISIFLDAESVLLFSATVPYYSIIIGLKSQVLPTMIGWYSVAVTTILAYYICWIFSKKHFGWIVGALVLFVVDSAFLAFIYIKNGDVSGILDALIHVWILYYLVTGIINGVKLANNKSEDTQTDTPEV